MVITRKTHIKQKGNESNIGKSFVSEIQSGDGNWIGDIVVLQDLVGAEASHCLFSFTAQTQSFNEVATNLQKGNRTSKPIFSHHKTLSFFW